MQKNTSDTNEKNYCMCYVVVYNLKNDTTEERHRVVGTKENIFKYIDNIGARFKVSEKCADTPNADDCFVRGGFFTLYDYDKKFNERKTYRVSVDVHVVEFVG